MPNVRVYGQGMAMTREYSFFASKRIFHVGWQQWRKLNKWKFWLKASMKIYNRMYCLDIFLLTRHCWMARLCTSNGLCTMCYVLCVCMCASAIDNLHDKTGIRYINNFIRWNCVFRTRKTSAGNGRKFIQNEICFIVLVLSWMYCLFYMHRTTGYDAWMARRMQFQWLYHAQHELEHLEKTFLW